MNGYRSATTGSLALALVAMSLSTGAASSPVAQAAHHDQTNDQSPKSTESIQAENANKTRFAAVDQSI